MTHLQLGDRVRVDRPRSKKHGTEGEVVWIGLDQYASTVEKFAYAVRVGPSNVVVPYEYLRVHRDGDWVTPAPLDPPEGFPA